MNQENQKEEPKFCKKLVCGNPTNPDILLGLVISDDGMFITFKTAHREKMISKNSIISIEDTKEIFRDGGEVR